MRSQRTRRQRGGNEIEIEAAKRTLIRAGVIVRNMDDKLKASIGEARLLKRAVAEGAAANAAAQTRLAGISRGLDKAARTRPEAKQISFDARKAEKVATKLAATVAKVKELGAQLRAAKNDLGLAEDAVRRAEADTATLRDELRKAGAARAAAALEPLVATADQLMVTMRALNRDVGPFLRGFDWARWQPRNARLWPALRPVYAALGEADPAPGSTFAVAPPRIRGLAEGFVGQINASVPRTLQANIDATAHDVRALHDALTSTLAAVQPRRRGGGRKTRRRVRFKGIRRSRRSSR